MRLTFPQIKTINEILSKHGFNSAAAADYIKTASDDDIQKLLAGDLSPLESAPVSSKGSCKGASSKASNAGASSAPCKAPSVAAPDLSSNKTTISSKAASVAVPGASLRGSDNTSDSLPASRPAASPAVVPEVVTGDDLPADIAESIDDIIHGYMQRFKIDDMKKASAEQWRGACMFIGDYIQKSKLLLDKSRNGSIIYDPLKVEKLLKLWAALCVAYSKPTLATDFISFSGISATYFQDNAGHELTSSRVDLRKKLYELQEAGLASGLVDGRKNPTGTIFFLKNWHGWKDSREIVHSSGSAAVGAGDLPVLGDNGTV